jgi:hypothetical protein
VAGRQCTGEVVVNVAVVVALVVVSVLDVLVKVVVVNVVVMVVLVPGGTVQLSLWLKDCMPVPVTLRPEQEKMVSVTPIKAPRQPGVTEHKYRQLQRKADSVVVLAFWRLV